MSTNKEIQQLIDHIKELHIQGALDALAQSLITLKTLCDATQDQHGYLALSFYNGSLDFHNGNFSGAIDYMEKILLHSDANHEPYYAMKAYSLLGIIYAEKSDFYLSLTFYLDAFRIAESHPEFAYRSLIYNNIGSLFVWLDENELAMDFLIDAYNFYFEDEQNDMPLLANLVVNIVEASFFIDDFSKQDAWSQKEGVVFSQEDQQVMKCLSLAKEIVLAHKKGNNQEVDHLLTAYIEHLSEHADGIFIFRCSLRMLGLAITYKLRETADKLIAILEELNDTTIIRSFQYSFSEIKVEYYYAFIAAQDSVAEQYLGRCCKQGSKFVNQLKKAYPRSLIAEIELYRTQNASASAMEHLNHLQKTMELDSFTGVYNKVSASHYAKTHFEDTCSRATYRVLFLLDIDFFKTVNDTYGHMIGDTVIQDVAEVLKSVCSENCVIGRFGGDEFMIYFDDFQSLDEISTFANALLSNARKIPLPDERIANLSLSIGIFISKDSVDFNTAFTRADEALYAAKQAGRDCFMFDRRKR